MYSTNLHVTGLLIAREELLGDPDTVLAVLALGPRVGAGPDLHHHAATAGGVAGRVDRGPRAEGEIRSEYEKR